MNKEQFKQIYASYLNNHYSTDNVKLIVEAYIKEKKGKDVDINEQSIIQHMQLSIHMMIVAMEYFANKHEIVFLIKNNGEKMIL